MQTLSLFLVEALETLDPKSPEFALDVVSFCESILEDPQAILFRQLDKLKGELMNQWKAEGIEYEDRMRRLEEVTWPKPKAELLYVLFDAFEAKHPWVGANNIRPKSIMRDMLERYMSFNEYVKELGLERIEGTLLRYLSEGFKTLVRTVPHALRTDELMDVIAFFRTVLARVDSSLIQEWERLMYGESAASRESAEEPLDITKDKKALRARIRAELHAIVRALAVGDWEDAAHAVRSPDDEVGGEPWGPERFEAALRPFFEEHERLVFDHAARMADKTIVRQVGPFRWEVKQVLCDPGGHNAWALEGIVDLNANRAPEGPMIAITRIGE
jgi:hypothetical protein